eukprot:gene32138-42892_t
MQKRVEDGATYLYGQQQEPLQFNHNFAKNANVRTYEHIGRCFSSSCTVRFRTFLWILLVWMLLGIGFVDAADPGQYSSAGSDSCFFIPTQKPSVKPSSRAPTFKPSATPTRNPSVIPSSRAPTLKPSATPTRNPSMHPALLGLFHPN